MTNDYFFYVLYCADRTLYAGYTTDLTRRLKEHNSGKGAKYTQVARRRPARMVYAERFASKSQAMSAEYHFKQYTRSEKDAYLSAQGVRSYQSASLVLVNRVDEGGKLC